jgi:hypothetical protein
MTPKSIRRATLLAASFGLAACDVVAFATDPKPIFEQTWNVPASRTSISVAELLPNNVGIYNTPGSNPPDSSAFLLSLNGVSFSRALGADCAQCQTLNGTNAVKPAFVLNAGSSTSLPTNVVSGAIVGATVNYSIVNNFSFDPIRVRAAGDPTQGLLVVVVRSGALVLGVDTVRGTTTTFPAGSTMSRGMSVGQGSATGAISVDLTVNSPQGDHNEFINANGALQTSASMANLRASSVSINVPSKSVAPAGEDLELSDFGDNVQSATIEMSVLNPWAVSGVLTMTFTSPSQTVTKTVSIPTGATPAATQVRTLTLDKTDMGKLVGQTVQMSLTGAMNATTPVTVTPRQVIEIDNRLIIKVQTGGGK